MQPDFMTCMQFYTAQQRIERFDAEHERIKAQRGSQEESQVRLKGGQLMTPAPEAAGLHP